MFYTYSVDSIFYAKRLKEKKIGITYRINIIIRVNNYLEKVSEVAKCFRNAMLGLEYDCTDAMI